MHNNPKNKWLILCLPLLCSATFPSQAEKPSSISDNPQELLTALKSSDPTLREEAARKFEKSAPFWPMDDVLPIALIAMRDIQAKVRASGIQSLATSAVSSVSNAARLKDAVPALLSRLSDLDWKVRQQAAGVFSYIQPNPPPETAPALIALLDDANDKVAKAAMDSLKMIGFGVPEVPARLLEMINHPDPYLQRHAIIDIQYLWQGRNDVDPAVIQALTKALSNKDKDVRMQAAQSLGSFGFNAEDAIPKLEERAADPKENKEMRATAQSSIRAIKSAPRAAPDLSTRRLSACRPPAKPVSVQGMPGWQKNQLPYGYLIDFFTSITESPPF